MLKLSESEEKSPKQVSPLHFPPQKRLVTASGYQHVFKKGKRQRATFFTFIFCANAFSYARLGLAIAKRHIPLAVERNRVRRIIRETFRQYQASLNGVDIVVITQKTLPDVSNACLREELNRIWQRFTTFPSKSC